MNTKKENDLDTVNVNEVLIENRMRKELGDVEQLSKSISDVGLIQPIVLTSFQENDLTIVKLVAGHRRFEALKKLGVQELEYGVHFLWRADLATDEYRRNAVELEENIRRKQMTWSEEVLGKARLLEIYQRIYGAPIPGQTSRTVQQGLKPAGFGVRKLAELLNESAGQTSEDLQMAALVEKIPSLKNEPSREAAKRKLELALRIQAGTHAVHMAKPLDYRILVMCENEAHQVVLLTQFRSAGLKCQAIVA